MISQKPFCTPAPRLFVERLSFFLLLAGCGLSSSAMAYTNAYSLFSVSGEPPEGLSAQTEGGITLNSGNTETSKYVARTQASYRFPEETVSLFGRYLYGSANGVRNESKWGAGTRYQRRLAPRWSAFAGQMIEADRFAGFFQRHITDLGIRRTLWEKEKTVAAMEVGGRRQFENRVGGETFLGDFGRVYVETSYEPIENALFLASTELLPNLRVEKDWMLNAGISVQSDLAKRLSLKTSYIWNYDHLPARPDLKRIDSVFVTTLLSKFD